MKHCGLCGRELGDVLIQEHHLIPKTFKGKVTVPMHKMCHQKAHATFSEREMLRYYHTFERMLEDEQIQKFVAWIAKKPLEFYDKNDDTANRRRQRKK